jgi:hypothetical protein
MTITNGYATAEELKSWIGVADFDDDLLLEAAINTASRGIDQYCSTFFYTTVLQSRTFSPRQCEKLDVPPITSTSGLIVKVDYADSGSYGTTLTITTDYVLKPDSGYDASGRTVPYNQIRTIGARYFPMWERPSVEVTATFGWAAVPDEINQACLIQASRIYRRRLTPEGFAAGEAFGAIRLSSRIDPDVMMMIDPFRSGGARVV